MTLGNKQTLANNIKKMLEQKGMNPRQMAIELGFKYTTVNDWVNAKSYPRIDKIEIMANYFGIKKSDLIEDKKPTTTLTQATNELIQAITDKTTQLTTPRQEAVLEYATEQLDEQEREIRERTTLYEVETVTQLAAGLGYSYDDNDIQTVQVEEEPPRYDLASLVNGDSMLPDYEDGDVVYLKDTGFSSYSGQVCAIAINDKSYLKKVYTEEDGLRLVSINKDYKDIFIDFPPSPDTHIKIYAVIGSDKVVSP